MRQRVKVYSQRAPVGSPADGCELRRAENDRIVPSMMSYDI